MSSKFDERIEDDEVLEGLLSFCDFRSAVTVGRTCRRINNLSNSALDHGVDTALARLPFDYDNIESGSDAILRSGWSNDYRSRVALIETALTRCDPGGQVSLEDEAEYDEEQARFLLRTRGMVDVDDFLVDGGGSSVEVGWNVNITFRAITLSQAAGHIAKAMKRLNGTDDRDKEERQVEQVERLRHCALCLLRKADPSSIKYARETWAYRHTDYPSGGSNSSVMFKIPDHDNTPVEFHLSTFFEVV
jgi:hypothetical protein